jgi:hypothetical protein
LLIVITKTSQSLTRSVCLIKFDNFTIDVCSDERFTKFMSIVDI